MPDCRDQAAIGVYLKVIRILSVSTGVLRGRCCDASSCHDGLNCGRKQFETTMLDFLFVCPGVGARKIPRQNVVSDGE